MLVWKEVWDMDVPLTAANFQVSLPTEEQNIYFRHRFEIIFNLSVRDNFQGYRGKKKIVGYSAGHSHFFMCFICFKYIQIFAACGQRKTVLCNIQAIVSEWFRFLLFCPFCLCKGFSKETLKWFKLYKITYCYICNIFWQIAGQGWVRATVATVVSRSLSGQSKKINKRKHLKTFNLRDYAWSNIKKAWKAKMGLYNTMMAWTDFQSHGNPDGKNNLSDDK